MMRPSCLEPRLLTVDMSQEIVSMMNSNGYTSWTLDLYDYYYRKYPFKTFQYGLFDRNRNICGFIGFAQLDFSISDVYVAWGMHALIDINHRNLLNFISLLNFAQLDLATNQNIDFLVGMPNQSAEKLYLQCLDWSLISYINFSVGHNAVSLSTNTERRFFIEKNRKWWDWRLSLKDVPDLVYQPYTHNGKHMNQILYSKKSILPVNQIPDGLPVCTWDHSEYTLTRSPWSCTFIGKLLSNKSIETIQNSSHWHLDMIDSDAFRPVHFNCIF